MAARALPSPPAPAPRPRPRAGPARRPLLLAAAVAVALALALPPCAHAVPPPVTESTDCHSLPAQSGLDFTKMRGSWYVVEVAEHLPRHGGPRAPVSTAACPMVDVWPSSHLTHDQRLHLKWRERSNYVNYELRLPEPDKHKGFWLVDQPQNGTLTESDKYRQFEGAVVVMKATATQLVFTFCSTPGPERQVYTMVLAREPSLPPRDLATINSMLDYRGLPETALKRTCKDFRGGAGSTSAPPLATLLLCALALLARLGLPAAAGRAL